MAAQHIFSSLALPVTTGLRITTSQGTFPRPVCHVLRTFTSASFLNASSQRRMQTSTAPIFVSQTMLPQIAKISDISNVNSLSQPHSKLPDQYNSNFDLTRSQRSDATFTEKETQRIESRTNNTSPLEVKTRPKLRARKAAIKLAPAAVRQLKKLSDQPSPKLIKIGVRNRGCSGLAYHLEYVDKSGSFDEEVEQDGVKVIIDSKALFSIIGSEMDWVEDKLNQRFIFKNPNIKEQCGCGESFMV
ncbi:hypothetical protein K3495_g3440 [Podosphaera aphanis]|nr:hypothetical protein K3495_g3440 [Podosphaera aphanis]